MEKPELHEQVLVTYAPGSDEEDLWVCVVTDLLSTQFVVEEVTQKKKCVLFYDDAKNVPYHTYRRTT